VRSPLEAETLFHVGSIGIQSQVVGTWAVMLVLCGGSALLTRRLSVREPGRWQLLLEMVVQTLCSQIEDTMRTPPRPFLPLIGTLFLFVLFANLSSMVPGHEAPTASLETDAAMGLIVFAVTIGAGLRTHGVRGYLASFTHPIWIMTPMNLIEQVTRTFSLVVRLFGNVMAGGFVVGIVLSLAALLVPLPFMALEVLAGVVQAYIFAILAAVFIGSAVEGE